MKEQWAKQKKKKKLHLDSDNRFSKSLTSLEVFSVLTYCECTTGDMEIRCADYGYLRRQNWKNTLLNTDVHNGIIAYYGTNRI